MYNELEKAAIVILCLENMEEGLGANLLKSLPTNTVKSIVSVMGRITAVEKGDVNHILTEFIESVDSGPKLVHFTEDMKSSVFRAISKSIDDDGLFLGELENLAKHNFSVLERFSASELFSIICGEKNQFCAVVLAHCRPEMSASVLKKFDDQRKVELVMAMSRIKEIDLETVDMIHEFLNEAIENKTKMIQLARRGPEYVAKVISSLGSASGGEILDKLKSTHPDLASQIEKEMFTFESVFMLGDRDFRDLCMKVSLDVWIRALKAESQTKVDQVIGSVSERNKIILREEIALDQPVRRIEKEDAQLYIITLVKTAIENGSYQDISSDDVWV